MDLSKFQPNCITKSMSHRTIIKIRATIISIDLVKLTWKIISKDLKSQKQSRKTMNECYDMVMTWIKK
jgi:hypothetical protein